MTQIYNKILSLLENKDNWSVGDRVINYKPDKDIFVSMKWDEYYFFCDRVCLNKFLAPDEKQEVRKRIDEIYSYFNGKTEEEIANDELSSVLGKLQKITGE